MIKDFQHQKANTIMDFLAQEGNRPRIFSSCLNGFHPLLRDNKTYIYSYSNELVVVVFDNSKAKTELADDEIFHCLLLKDRKLSEERLLKIQDVQVRYLTPRTMEQIPSDAVSAIRKELQALTGVEYAQ